MLELTVETEALAVRLAEARRVSVDVLVRGALEAQVGSMTANSRSKNEPPAADLAARRSAALSFYATEVARLPDLDARSVREITDDLNTL